MIALQETFCVIEACRRSGLPISTAYDWKHRHPEFAALWAKAEANAMDVMAGALYARAKDGTDAPIVSGGKILGTKKEFDNRASEFLLERRDPRYRRQADPAPTDQTPPMIFQFIGVKLGDQRTQTAIPMGEVRIPQGGTPTAPEALPPASNDEKPQENRTNEP